MSTPHIILLHGSTSAGKSSLARALQQALPGLWMHLGIDMFLNIMPLKYHHAAEGIRFVPQPDGAVPVVLGPFGDEVVKAFHRAVGAIAAGGVNIVIDDVILDQDALLDWAHALSGVDVFFVGVHCAPEELARREIARGDRVPGQYRSQIQFVHTLSAYDFEIDTSAASSEACAAAIIAAFDSRQKPTVFEQLGGEGASA